MNDIYLATIAGLGSSLYGSYSHFTEKPFELPEDLNTIDLQRANEKIKVAAELEEQNRIAKAAANRAKKLKTKTNMDKYDIAIEGLTENPSDIRHAWFSPLSHSHGCLFQFASSSGNFRKVPEGEVACLTMIKAGLGNWCAETPELTKAILADDRIPNDDVGITVDNLHVFAEWQRRLDKELNRV